MTEDWPDTDRPLRQPAAEAPARAPRSPWPWVISATLLAFALGLVGSPLFERSLRQQLPPTLRESHAETAEVQRLEQRLAAVEAAPPAAAVQAPAATPMDQALFKALEARTQAAETALAAVGGRQEALAAELDRTEEAVARAESGYADLFLLAATRRMVEAGRPLAPIEPALSRRYAASHPQALAALQAWSAAPQTRRTLAQRLPELTATAEPAEAGWWDRLRARLATLVTVEPSGASQAVEPAAVLAQAAEAASAGEVELAVGMLGDRAWPAPTARWLADARLLVAAEDALGRLEAEALEATIGRLGGPGPQLPVNAGAGLPAPAPPEG